jgi:hypothetical protein
LMRRREDDELAQSDGVSETGFNDKKKQSK